MHKAEQEKRSRKRHNPVRCMNCGTALKRNKYRIGVVPDGFCSETCAAQKRELDPLTVEKLAAVERARVEEG